eukprot:6189448-Pleurochrysis_carterae.AAC.2
MTLRAVAQLSWISSRSGSICAEGVMVASVSSVCSSLPLYDRRRRSDAELSFCGITIKAERVAVAHAEVFEVSFTFGALEAAPKPVEVVKLEDKEAVSEACRRGGSAEADGQPMPELLEVREVLATFEAALEA